MAQAPEGTKGPGPQQAGSTAPRNSYLRGGGNELPGRRLTSILSARASHFHCAPDSMNDAAGPGHGSQSCGLSRRLSRHSSPWMENTSLMGNSPNPAPQQALPRNPAHLPSEPPRGLGSSPGQLQRSIRTGSKVHPIRFRDCKTGPGKAGDLLTTAQCVQLEPLASYRSAFPGSLC